MQNELFKRIISSIFLIPLSVFFIIQGSALLIIFLLVCFFIALYEWNKMSKNLLIKIVGTIFLAYSFYTAYQIRTISNVQYYFIFFVIGICVATDIGGFLFGKIFKGPKLTNISPNKTYTGMIGGYILAIIFASVYINAFQINTEATSKNNLLLLTIILSTISQIGDLTISLFKRISNLKDTGKIIPGHGGILDRIDGMIFAFPVAYLIKSFKILEIF